MRKRKYYKMHIPLDCNCKDREKKVFVEYTTQEMTDIEFLALLDKWNYQGQGHWQFWS